MNIQFNAAAVRNNEIYFSAKNYNGLFKLRLEDSSVSFVTHFPGDELWIEHMHQFAFSINQYIYFIPYFAHYISKYNIESGEIVKIALFEGDGMSAISNVINRKNKYFLIPRELSNPIAVLDPEMDEISYLSITSKRHDLIKAYSDIYSAAIVRDELLIPVYDSDNIVKIDLEKMECSDIILNGTRNSAITYFNEKLWMISSDGSEIYCYSDKYELVKKYRCTGNSNRPFESWVNVSGKLYLCGCLDDRIIRYDEKSDKWNELQCKGILRKIDRWAFMCGFENVENKIYLFPSATNALAILEEDRISVVEVEFMDKELYDRIRMKKTQFYFEKSEPEIQSEGQNLSIDDMLFYLSSK